MPSKWADTPVLRINTVITAGLRTESIIPAEAQYITETDTQNPQALPFMIPAQQTPEHETPYNNAFVELPYCVYTWSQRNESDAPWCFKGQITYNFYSSDADKLIEIMNYVNDLTKREDWSAADFNQYFNDNDPTNPWDFKCIHFLTSAGPSDSDDEGGRLFSLLVIRYDAVYEGPNRTGVVWNAGHRGMIE